MERRVAAEVRVKMPWPPVSSEQAPPPPTSRLCQRGAHATTMGDEGTATAADVLDSWYYGGLP